jgi:beta-lactam-binding protein with PASTA domain
VPALDPQDILKGLEDLVPGPRLPQRVSVPEVVGLKVSVASMTLAKEGLRVVTHMAVASPPAVEGVVVRQSRPPGEQVRRGTAVELLLDFTTDGRSDVPRR